MGGGAMGMPSGTGIRPSRGGDGTSSGDGWTGSNTGGAGGPFRRGLDAGGDMLTGASGRFRGVPMEGGGPGPVDTPDVDGVPEGRAAVGGGWHGHPISPVTRVPMCWSTLAIP